MKKLLLSATLAGIVVLVVASVAVAADRIRGRDQVRDRDAAAEVLGLEHAAIVELRQDGLSLAQIAERQKVDPQRLVDALQTRWTERIATRVANGALTDAEATQLREQVETRARDMVYRTTAGGMQGAAVGAGPQGAGQGAGEGMGRGMGGGMGRGAGGNGAGAGTCDGSGPHGPGQP